MLLRGLLDMPNQPAVLALQAFALQFDHIALGGDLHLSAGQFYDIPTISLRNAILEDIFANGSLVSQYFTPTAQGPDLRHVGLRSDVSGAERRSHLLRIGSSASLERRISTARYARWTEWA